MHEKLRIWKNICNNLKFSKLPYCIFRWNYDICKNNKLELLKIKKERL